MENISVALERNNLLNICPFSLFLLEWFSYIFLNKRLLWNLRNPLKMHSTRNSAGFRQLYVYRTTLLHVTLYSVTLAQCTKWPQFSFKDWWIVKPRRCYSGGKKTPPVVPVQKSHCLLYCKIWVHRFSPYLWLWPRHQTKPHPQSFWLWWYKWLNLSALMKG